MRLIYAAFILLLVLMTTAQCQLTAEVWFDKGVDLCKQGKYDDGIKAYNEAIEINPNIAFTWNNKAEALNRIGKYDEAINASNKAIELDPNIAEPWYNKGNALK
jgi:tetratricopeptide (TPR) repeat protein